MTTLKILLKLILIQVFFTGINFSQSIFYVSPDGNDSNSGTESEPWLTIKKAFNFATPGSTVLVKKGVYYEKDTVNVSGNPVDGYITFRNFQNDTVVIDGTGKIGDQLIFIENKNYIKIIGFELRNNINQSFGSGIWVKGSCSNIHITKNVIHDMRAKLNGDCMAISVYGTSSDPISNITIDSNLIYNCEPGHSEAIAINGNVDTFWLLNNVVHDVNNIGIVMIGGEGECPIPSLDLARNGVCRGNTAYNAHSNYGGGYAAGIYVDGGMNIIIENNCSYSNDIGIEVGCENNGRIASGIIVRNNLVFVNEKRGISIGGYNYPTTGKVINTKVLNNTVFNNDLLNKGNGEITIEYAEDCEIKNNIFYSSAHNVLLVTTVGNSNGNILDYNIWYAPGGLNNVLIDYNGTVYSKYSDYVSGTGQDINSKFDNPKFFNTSLPALDFHLQFGSPAIDCGDPLFIADEGEVDYDGSLRVFNQRVDAGAYESFYIIPPVPDLIEPSDNDVIQSQPIVMRWTVPDGDYLYHIQIAADSGFESLHVNDSSLTDMSYEFHPGVISKSYFWRVRAVKLNIPGDWTRYRKFVYNNPDHWEIVSLAYNVLDPSKTTLFPSAISNAFFYESDGYVMCESLVVGNGYWIKFGLDTTSNIIGDSIFADTINVIEGWNLIGSISIEVPTSTIITDPSDIILSGFYSYKSGYIPTEIIRPGKGYWVKVGQNGKIILMADPGIK